MDQLIPVVGTTALLGSALVGGIFYSFSSFVMKALARVPPAEGIGAMQSINVVVLNLSFLGVFIGTTVVSLGTGGLALAGWDRPSAPFFLGGALFYVVGTFLVTGLKNVPLNDQLAAVSATDPAAHTCGSAICAGGPCGTTSAPPPRWSPRCCTPWVSCRTRALDVPSPEQRLSLDLSAVFQLLSQVRERGRSCPHRMSKCCALGWRSALG